MSRRPPPKQRHRERPRRQARSEQLPDARDDPNGWRAPDHLAGQFEQHDYGHGHGAFGFTQHMLP